MLMEYIVPSLSIVLLMCMLDNGALQDRLEWLMQLVKDRFLATFHQAVQKQQHKT